MEVHRDGAALGWAGVGREGHRGRSGARVRIIQGAVGDECLENAGGSRRAHVTRLEGPWGYNAAMSARIGSRRTGAIEEDDVGCALGRWLFWS